MVSSGEQVLYCMSLLKCNMWCLGRVIKAWGGEGSGLKIQVCEDAMLLLKKLNTFYHHKIHQLIFSFLWLKYPTKATDGKKGFVWLVVWGRTIHLAGQASGRTVRQLLTLPLPTGSTGRHILVPHPVFPIYSTQGPQLGSSSLFSYTFLKTLSETHKEVFPWWL